MKTKTLKRLLAFVLAAMLLLSLTACFDDDTDFKDNDYKSEYDGPTLRVPGQSMTFPTIPTSGSPNATKPSNPTKPKDDPTDTGTVTVYAHVPADWKTPYCWAWNDTTNAFESWPGKAMTKKGDWYQVQVPNWVNNVIISNNGSPQTDDLVVLKGYNVWLVVDANGTVSKYYSEPEIKEPSKPSTPTTPGMLSHKDLAYVMIYNPNIYDENKNWNTNSLSTGYLGSQIDVDAHRGSGLEEEFEIGSVSQSDIMSGVDLGIFDLDGNRGDGLGYEYSVGDTKRFYCTTAGNANCNVRSPRDMTCVYAGTYCYVWNDGSMTDAQLKQYGREFDTNVYEALVEEFGKPRFVGDGGKVNLLFYPITGGTGGYFHPYDLYSSSEATPYDVTNLGMNLDHAIVHLNSNFASNSNYQTWMKGTLAHEFQHLLCFTAYFNSKIACRTWLNEAMSGYIEEQLYPGGKYQAGQLTAINNSNLIRKGQSLYNFSTASGDIGAYSAVYYFAEYLAAYAGKDVFSKIHDYWRNSYSRTLSEAEAIYNCVPASFRNSIDQFVTYSNSTKFASKEEAWMSKLTLHYYMVMFSKEGNLANYYRISIPSLLYDEMSGTTIEGGGRIVLATKDTSFEIPKDADSGLIYVGLDKNFNVITSYVP